MPWTWQEDSDGFRSKVRHKGAGKGPGMGKGKGKGKGKGAERRPEWRCRCGAPNFMERNWCRRCGLDYTHGEPIQPSSPELTNGKAHTLIASPGSLEEETNAGTKEASSEPARIANMIKFHKSLLAAARQHGDTPEARAEVARQEEELKRLASAEREAQPDRDRLRSLLDRVKYREGTAAAKQAEVQELQEMLQEATESASQAAASLNEAKLELHTLQETMAAASAASKSTQEDTGLTQTVSVEVLREQLAKERAANRHAVAALQSMVQAAEHKDAMEDTVEATEGDGKLTMEQALAQAKVALTSPNPVAPESSEVTATQEGDRMPTQEELDGLIRQLPPQYLSQVVARLTQPGVVEAATEEARLMAERKSLLEAQRTDRLRRAHESNQPKLSPKQLAEKAMQEKGGRVA